MFDLINNDIRGSATFPKYLNTITNGVAIMSNTIYSTQEKLDSILNIERTKYEYPDAELFDTSDYPNNGKGSSYFDWTGMKHTEESKRKMSKSAMGNKNSLGHKQTEEHKKNTSIAMKKAATGRIMSDETKRKMSESHKRRWKKRKELSYN